MGSLIGRSLVGMIGTLALILVSEQSARTDGGNVTALDGSVVISGPSGEPPVQVNAATIVQNGHVVQTGPGSSTTITFAEALVIAGENSRVTIQERTDGARGDASLVVTVERGTVRVVTDPEATGRVEVRTPDLTVVVTAHVFVSVNDSHGGVDTRTVTRVAPIGPEGAISIRTSAGQQTVRVGEVVVVQDGVSVAAVQTPSQQASWLAQTTPKHAAVMTMPRELIHGSIDGFLGGALSTATARPGVLPPIPVMPDSRTAGSRVQIPQINFTPPAVVSGAAQGSTQTSINQATIIQTQSGISTTTSSTSTSTNVQTNSTSISAPPVTPQLPTVKIPIPAGAR